MWQDYIKKQVIVKELEEERGFNNNPISLIVLQVKQIELNEMALVSSIRGDIYWTYCSRYVVLSVEDISFENAEWYQYIGCNILVTNNIGEVSEELVLEARGQYALVKNKFEDMGFSCKWIDVHDYTVRN